MIEVCELDKDGKDLILARVWWTGDHVAFSGDEETCDMVADYTTHSDPTGTVDDGEAWVDSLPEALDDTYFWARQVQEPMPVPEHLKADSMKEEER